MEHVMNLQPSPFYMIKTGAKKIELRLYDEKRKQVKVGDTVRFYNMEDASETIVAKVTALYVFKNFDELYKNLPLLECGYTEADAQYASPNDMEKYYSLSEQAQFGVVGIRVEVI